MIENRLDESMVIMKDGTVRNLPVYAIGWPVVAYGILVPIDDCNDREARVVPDGDYFKEVSR